MYIMSCMAINPRQLKMIHRLLKVGTEAKIANLLEKTHPSDLSILFSELSPNEVQRLVNSLFLVSKAGLTLRELPELMLPDILELIDDDKLTTIISRLEPDDAFFLLEKIPDSRWRVILDNLPEHIREKLDKLLCYPRDSAGSVMTSNYMTVKAEMTVDQAIQALRVQPDIDGIFYIYVVDDGNHLVGTQSLRYLVTAAPQKKISEVMNHNVHAIKASEPKEAAAKIVTQYNILAIPVVNDSHELVGVITIDDVLDIVKEEATEDIYHMAGLSEDDRATTPLAIKVKKRMPWMVLNLATAILASSVVGFFQESIQKFVALAVFMPIVAGMGGNCAAQSLTVITRSIALGELSFIKTYRAILKELANGLIIGLVTGIIAGGIGYYWMGNFYLGITLILAMIINLAVGGLMGAIVPITLKTLKLDPAVGSTVIVTTFTDVCGFMAFLGIATLLMKHLVP